MNYEKIKNISRSFFLGWALLYVLSSLFVVQHKLVYLATIGKNLSVLPVGLFVLLFLATSLLNWLYEHEKMNHELVILIWGVTWLIGLGMIILRLFL